MPANPPRRSPLPLAFAVLMSALAGCSLITASELSGKPEGTTAAGGASSSSAHGGGGQSATGGGGGDACGSACGPKACCDGVCVDLTQPEHCGGCGVACNDNELCCDKACTDFRFDEFNCGACGKTCPGTICLGGDCTNQCNAPFEDCNKNMALDGCEANLSSDPNHCGSCAVACPANAICNGGMCMCPVGFADCDNDTSNGCEVDLQSNPLHCGDCAHPCGPNQDCVAGACVCSTGFGDCNHQPSDGCEAPLDAPEHCGSCTNDCGVHTTCVDPAQGKCGCATGYLDCDQQPGCEASDSSMATCGNCNNPCTGGRVCSGGTCQLGCTGGQQNCSGGCVDTQTSLENCGGCGMAVGPHQTCAGGVPVCVAGWGDCDGNGSCETDLSMTEAHCGTCPNACHPGAFCVGGSCACGVGTHDCGTYCALCCSDTDCSDGDGCTTDVCNPGGGSCSHPGCGAMGQQCCGGQSCADCCMDADCGMGKSCSGGTCVNGCSGGTTLCNGSCGEPHLGSVELRLLRQRMPARANLLRQRVHAGVGRDRRRRARGAARRRERRGFHLRQRAPRRVGRPRREQRPRRRRDLRSFDRFVGGVVGRAARRARPARGRLDRRARRRLGRRDDRLVGLRRRRALRPGRANLVAPMAYGQGPERASQRVHRLDRDAGDHLGRRQRHRHRGGGRRCLRRHQRHLVEDGVESRTAGAHRRGRWLVGLGAPGCRRQRRQAGPTNAGFAYDPAMDSWRSLPTQGAPSARVDAFAVMTSAGFLVAGGVDASNSPLRDAYLYDPVANAWHQASSMPAGDARSAPFGTIGWTAWTGTRALLVEGFVPGTGDVKDVLEYQPNTDTWTGGASASAQHELGAHAFTGAEMIVWSGLDMGSLIASGERFKP